MTTILNEMAKKDFQNPERVNRSVGIDREDWDYLAKLGRKNNRTPAAELRRLLRYAILCDKAGKLTLNTDPEDQVDKIHAMVEKLESRVRQLEMFTEPESDSTITRLESKKGGIWDLSGLTQEEASDRLVNQILPNLFPDAPKIIEEAKRESKKRKGKSNKRTA